eukprot:TRINITY_DN5597_c0_g1_i1.p1 TRINITY_DN5597_c0_g1~~TRINITY_DN5597_c0_g1_i1.p1  ORF type:complete len:131 (+),score=23.28 TRINITY_DN5597_c0_g1_i1:44-436(+)
MMSIHLGFVLLLFIIVGRAEMECTDEEATEFADCLRSRACGGVFEDEQEKCDCYEDLADCYKQTVDKCVSTDTFREFQRTCVRNAGCEIDACTAEDYSDRTKTNPISEEDTANALQTTLLCMAIGVLAIV